MPECRNFYFLKGTYYEKEIYECYACGNTCCFIGGLW